MNREANYRSLSGRCVCAVVALCLGILSCSAEQSELELVEDAKAFAMEAAMDHVKKGFRVRSEQWTGVIKAGSKKAVKHQLYKGNEYWFWLGVSDEVANVSINVFDKDGKGVASKKIAKKGMGAVRVTPPKTGTYYVVIEVKSSPRKQSMSYALAYGYK